MHWLFIILLTYVVVAILTWLVGPKFYTWPYTLLIRPWLKKERTAALEETVPKTSDAIHLDDMVFTLHENYVEMYSRTTDPDKAYCKKIPLTDAKALTRWLETKFP